jgi:hypothetical protein
MVIERAEPHGVSRLDGEDSGEVSGKVAVQRAPLGLENV